MGNNLHGTLERMRAAETKRRLEERTARMLGLMKSDPDLVRRFNEATPEQLKEAGRRAKDYRVTVDTAPGLVSKGTAAYDRIINTCAAVGAKLVDHRRLSRTKTAERAMKTARAIVMGKRHEAMILTPEFMILLRYGGSSAKSKKPAKPAGRSNARPSAARKSKRSSTSSSKSAGRRKSR